MKYLFYKVARLLDVKSIITIGMLILFAILSIRGVIVSESVTELFKIIIIFYFGTQSGKLEADLDAKNELLRKEESSNERK